MPEEQATAIVASIVNSPPREGQPSGHALATCIQQDRHTQGDRGRGRMRRSGGGRGGGGRGKQTNEAVEPPYRRTDQNQERHKTIGSGSETEAYEEEENEEEWDRDGDTPRVALVEVIHVGWGRGPPWRKTRTYLTSPRTVHICCCRKSTETFHITTMGCT